MSNQPIVCATHNKPKTSICLTEGCNTLVCPDCTSVHRQTHATSVDQKIMNFGDVLSFSVESQKKLYSDSLQQQLQSMTDQEYQMEVQEKVKNLKQYKQVLRNVVREFFDELATKYQELLLGQQESYMKGIKLLRNQVQLQLKQSQTHLQVMLNDSLHSSAIHILMTPSRSSKSPGLSSKFKLTSSHIKKEIDLDDDEPLDQENQQKQYNGNESVSSRKRVDIQVTQTMANSVIQTIKDQEAMKTQLKKFKMEGQNIFEEFGSDKLFVDKDIEENFKEFLAGSFNLSDSKKKIKQLIKQQTNDSPETPILNQKSSRSPSPINYLPNQLIQGSRKNSQQFLADNSMSSLGISLPLDQQQNKSIQIPPQIKQWEHKPLTLTDLEVNTHDYFMSKPFLHFFNIKDNQIVIQYIGVVDDNVSKKAEYMPNRARFQSTYLADPKSIALQQAKNSNISSQIFRNIFKGGIDKKTLNSTFAIPLNHRSIALPNREIYVVGGQYDGETVPFVFKYNWEGNQLVEAAKPLIVSRANFGIAQLNNYIYVIGGQNEKLGTLKSCEIMDVITKQWSPIADLNVACRELSVCAFNNRILYKFGGVGADDQLNEYIEKQFNRFLKLKRYEPNTNRWISFHIQNKNSLRSKFQLCSLSGAVQINSTHIMVFGGSDAGLSEDSDQTFLCEVGPDYCKIVGLNKVTISTKGAVASNPLVQNNRIYAMQYQRDKKGNFHPYKRNMMLYEEKCWKVNH